MIPHHPFNVDTANTASRVRSFVRGHISRLRSKGGAGFTLIETLVAISLLSIAIVAPMTLTTQSLAAAYYARDQVTAFFIAQEGIEAVRSIRDGNILSSALGSTVDLMNGICNLGPNVCDPPGEPFTVDTVHLTNNNPTLALCGGTCPPLETDGEFYGYSFPSVTNFTRSITATYATSTDNEILISVTVTWQTAAFQTRSFTLSENMYKWFSVGP